MVRGYVRRRTYSRRPVHKRYGKKYNRRRFTKKRFARNNINQLTMRAPLASRMLRIKLPWVKTFSPSVAASGSQFYAFAGSSLFPYVAGAQTNTTSTPLVTTGDSLPAGAVEYSNFYDKFFINGSSIKVEAMSVNSQALATSPLIRAVLIAIPYTGLSQSSPSSYINNDNWPDVRDQLNGYTYEQLLAWPYAKWRMIGSNSGGSSRLIFKMFRKTKNMCGLKDLRDNAAYGGLLTDGTTSFVAPVNVGIVSNGFMYFLKFFNQDTTTAANLALTVRMSLYFTMINREFNPITSVTVSPP